MPSGNEITIITNNVPRDVLYGYELTHDERKEFDYLTWDDEEGNAWYNVFARYKGQVYDLNDTEGAPPMGTFGTKWDRYISDTFFSGVLFRFVDDYEQVICGRYYG